VSYDFSVAGTNQTSRLRPHPLNAEIYGDSAPDVALVESIRQHGILNPIVINAQKEILSGTRRWLAAKELGLKSVPVITLANETWTKDKVLSERDVLRSQLFLVESNKARVKTEAQKDAEAAALLRIESELAKERQKQGRTNLADPTEAGRAVDKVAKATGESAANVQKRIAIHETKMPADERNKQSTNAAYENLPKPTPCDICQAAFESKGAMKAHRKKEHAPPQPPDVAAETAPQDSKCPNCDVPPFPSKTKLKQHRLEVHNIGAWKQYPSADSPSDNRNRLKSRIELLTDEQVLAVLQFIENELSKAA
jgi:hypothetical protein